MDQFQSSKKLREIDSCPKCVQRPFTVGDKWKMALIGSVKCSKCNTTWGFDKLDNIKATIGGFVIYILVLTLFEEYFQERIYEFAVFLLISIFSSFFTLYATPKEKPTEPEVDWNDFFDDLRKE